MDETLPRMVLDRAERFAGRTALRRKESGRWHDISWHEVEGQIRAFGRGLLAMGLAPGDRVAIMAPNAPEWIYADLGAMAAGGLSVPVYHTDGIGNILHILRDSGSRFLFLHSAAVASELADLRDKLPHLEQVVLLAGGTEAAGCLTLAEFLKRAGTIPMPALEQRLAAGRRSDVATIVYTSGTTGPAKGVMLTHDNFLANIDACTRLFAIGPEDECLSFLPLSHVFERMAGYYLMLRQGAVIAYAESFDAVPANLAEVRPTVAISVPRLYEKMFARVMERVLSGPWLSKQLFFSALRAGKALIEREQAGGSGGWPLRASVAAGRRLVFARLRQHLGGRLRFFVSGGAPLGRDIAEFFFAAGLPVYEGYGLTETSPVVAVNTPVQLRLGTVGRPIPGTEVRIAADGEILVRGPGVFQGYWQQPERTREVLVDGWFHTGDVGRLDADGFLTITDRIKDLIVTAGGENIAPQPLENLLKTDKYIANAAVFGDRKPYLTALIVPNFDNLEKFAREHRLDFLNHCDLVSHPRILELIRSRIDRLQAPLPPIQRIKRLTLLSRDFAAAAGEMTPTLKVRRKVVAEHFHRLLEEMYLTAGRDIRDSGFCLIESDGGGRPENDVR